MDGSSRHDQLGMTRRALLGLAVAGGALGAAGLLVGGRVGSWHYPLADREHLNARMQAALQALGQLWLPPPGEDFPHADAVDMLGSIDASMGLLSEELRRQVGLALQAFEVGAVAYGWHGVPFSFLPPDQARAYVDRWLAGHAVQRSLVLAMRQLVCLSYWRHADTWPATGYLGPLHQRVSLPVLGDAPEPQRT